MTKEENIATLNEHLEHWKRLLSEKICDQDEGEKTIDALQNAIKALEQEPCGDAVSRQVAINAAIDGADKWDGGFNREREKCIQEEIEKLPSVTPKPKMGWWAILKDEYGDVVEAVCSNCDKNGNHKWAFCPYCGQPKDAEGSDKE